MYRIPNTSLNSDLSPSGEFKEEGPNWLSSFQNVENLNTARIDVCNLVKSLDYEDNTPEYFQFRPRKGRPPLHEGIRGVRENACWTIDNKMSEYLNSGRSSAKKFLRLSHMMFIEFIAEQTSCPSNPPSSTMPEFNAEDLGYFIRFKDDFICPDPNAREVEEDCENNGWTIPDLLLDNLAEIRSTGEVSDLQDTTWLKNFTIFSEFKKKWPSLTIQFGYPRFVRDIQESENLQAFFVTNNDEDESIDFAFSTEHPVQKFSNPNVSFDFSDKSKWSNLTVIAQDSGMRTRKRLLHKDEPLYLYVANIRKEMEGTILVWYDKRFLNLHDFSTEFL